MKPTELKIQAGEIDQIVSSVLQTMLGVEVSRTAAVRSPQPDWITATVHFAGARRCAVVLEFTRAQARRFAGHYLSIEPPETVDDDVRDVLGELVNMIGGNLKGSLAPGATLSMPSVIDGRDYGLRICNVTLVERCAFACACGVFWVSCFVTSGSNGRCASLSDGS